MVDWINIEIVNAKIFTLFCNVVFSSINIFSSLKFWLVPHKTDEFHNPSNQNRLYVLNWTEPKKRLPLYS